MSENSVPVSTDPDLPLILGLFTATFLVHALFTLGRALRAPVRAVVRWVRAPGRHKASEAREDAETVAWVKSLHEPALERVASPAFRSSFDPPWDEAPKPARVQPTVVPDPVEQPLPAETPSNEVPEHEPAPEPVPAGELAPWVKEALGGHDGPDAALESIVKRAMTP